MVIVRARLRVRARTSVCVCRIVIARVCKTRVWLRGATFVVFTCKYKNRSNILLSVRRKTAITFHLPRTICNSVFVRSHSYL